MKPDFEWSTERSKLFDGFKVKKWIIKYHNQNCECCDKPLYKKRKGYLVSSNVHYGRFVCSSRCVEMLILQLM